MISRHSGSEEALGTIACERIKARSRPQILIGGLGMGFTLRAALAELGPKARIVVAELVPAVLAWARGSMLEVFGTSLKDPRVRIRESDVGHLIRSSRSTLTWRDCAPLARRCVPVAYSRCGHRDQTCISLGDFARLVLTWMRLGCAPMDRAAARGMLFGSRAMLIMGIRRSTFDDSSAHFRR
jgi:hypothetical protein